MVRTAANYCKQYNNHRGATKRIKCLLDAFAADDIDKAIDEPGPNFLHRGSGDSVLRAVAQRHYDLGLGFMSYIV